MRWKNWIGITTLSLLIATAGCGEEQKATELIPTPPVQQDISSFFEEVDQKEIEITAGGTLQGQKEELEKIDAANLIQYNAANSFISTSLNDNQQSLFCIDPETGAAYFVNQNKDWFIYRIKGNSVEVAVELPARELSIWNGVLYFIVDDYDEYTLTGIEDGDIYSYTPATGEVQRIYCFPELGNALESHMVVNENGINFVYGAKKGVVINDKTWTLLEDEYYCLPFGSSEIIEDIYKSARIGWNEYYLASPGLLKSRTDEVPEDISLGLTAFRSFISGDDFYTMDAGNKIIYVKNLISGEVKKYDCGEALQKYDEKASDRGKEGVYSENLQDFTITEEYIWVIAQYEWLIRIEPETGEMECYRLAPENTSCGVKRLYTDGRQIYALYSAGAVDNAGFITRILLDEIVDYNSIYNNAPILAVEYLTK